MTLDIFVGEFAQRQSFLFNHVVVAGWGLLITVTTVLVLVPLILKRKKKAKNINLLIYHNRQYSQLNLQQQPSEQWEKAKTHIEKLLYEITENQPINEPANSRPVELSTSDKQYCFENCERRHANKIPVKKNVKPEQLKRTRPPLDVSELQAVATLAKRLQSRNRHRITT